MCGVQCEQTRELRPAGVRWRPIRSRAAWRDSFPDAVPGRRERSRHAVVQEEYNNTRGSQVASFRLREATTEILPGCRSRFGELNRRPDFQWLDLLGAAAFTTAAAAVP